ncbi:MAG: preprotein translocase subunit SecE [Lachnospiraceae bacterium]|nr:preprotein translocase subunit SecE [Lachnospiraceae bacterium]MBR6157263.1 preprotein translocase subunit SecE [Lachnospiraceae bacterium]
MANTEEKKAKKPPFLKGVKTEYKKISWPEKKSLTRQTVAVVVITTILSVLIALLDYVIKYGVEFLTTF